MKNSRFLVCREENLVYRFEQLRCANILRYKLEIAPNYIKTEYPVNDLTWEDQKVGCILDIAIVPPGTQYKIAIRLMGEIHTKNKKIVKDDIQKQALENAGWSVYDFIDENMPNLWNKEKLSPDKDILATNEILKELEIIE